MPPAAASGETWPMDRPEVPPEKRPSVIRAHSLPRPLGFQIAGRVQHFLHPRPALWPLIPDHQHIAGLDAVGQDRLNSGVLQFEHAGGAREDQDQLVHPGGFHDAAVGRDIALQHRKAAVFGKGVFGRADDALFAVGIKAVVFAVGREGVAWCDAARGREEEVGGRFRGWCG